MLWNVFSGLNDIIIFGLVVHAYYFSQLTKLYVSTVAAFAFKITPKKQQQQSTNIKTHTICISTNQKWGKKKHKKNIWKKQLSKRKLLAISS